MEADTGTKMIHLGRDTKSRIVSKGISADQSVQSYRGLVKVGKDAAGAQNYSQCDSMLIGGECTANTYPYIEAQNSKSKIEHEASTSRVSAEQLFYLQSRGLAEEEAVSLLVNGFCKEVFNQLPLEFSVEAVKLLEMKLEGAVG
jgi:Fe-S cluster assembly protein SufB